ncbi:polysaccharide deacetylase family protein [Paenibacillus selenitireducens]|uniref:polysaccharide deacetylase family protein n=1 Tax=Paenibacillus selenitireducens TaxID=1324314 RepID=UPI001E2E8243|nr:polysaccharide deacetylase family protein [Paenibacillus selenitireducens]
MLATLSLMIFFIGKLTSDPDESVAEESIHPVATMVIEQSNIQDTVQPEKQKRPDGKPIGKVVYLTFDDGPSILTNQFLDVLKEQDVKATFLCREVIYKKPIYKRE